MEMQPKLLRVLEAKEFERIGGTKVLHSNFRLIAATNQDLERLIREKRFRKDLFYRLNVIPLNIPPLRERKKDIVEIAQHLISQMAREMTLADVSMDAEAETTLKNFDWQGNVRELSNVLERAISSLEGDTLTRDHLPLYLHRGLEQKRNRRYKDIKEVQTRAEKEAILMALKESDFNKSQAAKRLGIHRTLLYKKMKKYAIQPKP